MALLARRPGCFRVPTEQAAEGTGPAQSTPVDSGKVATGRRRTFSHTSLSQTPATVPVCGHFELVRRCVFISSAVLRDLFGGRRLLLGFVTKSLIVQWAKPDVAELHTVVVVLQKDGANHGLLLLLPDFL